MILASVLILLTLIILVCTFREYPSQLAGYILKSGAAITALVLIIVLTLYLDIREYDKRKRLALIHMPASSESGEGYAIHQCLYRTLRISLSGEILVYPQEWFYRVFHTDSITNRQKLSSIAKRLNVDYLFLTEVNGFSNEKFQLKLDAYDLYGDTLLLKKQVVIDDASDYSEYRDPVRSILACFHIHTVKDSIFKCTAKNALTAYGRGILNELSGQLDKAKIWYKRAEAIDPESTDIRISNISVELKRLSQTGKDVKSLQDHYLSIERQCHDLISSDSGRAEPYLYLGYINLLQERYTRASYWLSRSYQMDADNPETLVLLSRFHPDRFKKLGFKDKESLLHRAADLNPAYVRAWIALAEQAYRKNNFKKAEEFYNKLLFFTPSSVDGLLGLGRIYQRQERFEDMINIYQKILTVSPDYAEAYYNLGIAYYRIDKIREAVSFFQKALQQGKPVNAHLYLGMIYSEIDKKKAIYHYRKRIEHRQGADDRYAEEARIRLAELLHEKESI